MNATAARERHASEACGFTDFEILRTREGDEMVVHTRLVEAPRGGTAIDTKPASTPTSEEEHRG